MARRYMGLQSLARITDTSQPQVACRGSLIKTEPLQRPTLIHHVLGHDLDLLRLRGPCGARDEFHLAAAAQNLRKLAKLKGAITPRPA